MKGREYLHTRNVVFDLRKELLKQKVILTDCYYWKDVYEALRLEKEEERERCIKIIKSHIASTYPINCKSICNEINDLLVEKAPRGCGEVIEKDKSINVVIKCGDKAFDNGSFLCKKCQESAESEPTIKEEIREELNKGYDKKYTDLSEDIL